MWGKADVNAFCSQYVHRPCPIDYPQSIVYSSTMDIATLLDSLSYVGIFIYMLANGIFSFPSSQILYLALGVFVAKGSISLIYAVIAGALGNTLGNYIVYIFFKKYGRALALQFMPFQEKAIVLFEEKVKRKGIWLLFVGKLTPSLKVLVPPVAGMAKIKKMTAIILFSLTSFIWAYAFIYIGFLFGDKISTQWYIIIMGLLGGVIALLFYKKVMYTK